MKDSFIFGVAAGALAPILAYIISINNFLDISFLASKPISVYVLAAVINLVIMRFTYRAGKENFAKGVILMTFLALLILIFGGKLKV